MLVYAQPRPYRRCYSAVGPISRPDSSAANSFRQSAPCQPPQSSNSHRHKNNYQEHGYNALFLFFFPIDEGIAKYILRTNALITTTAVNCYTNGIEGKLRAFAAQFRPNAAFALVKYARRSSVTCTPTQSMYFWNPVSTFCHKACLTDGSHLVE